MSLTPPTLNEEALEFLRSTDATRFIKSWSPYMKPGWKPLPLQLAFAILPNKEILFGGSAGGGKSESMLAAALQYTDTPNYSAIIYRKTYQDLIRPGALLDRALEWLSPYLGREVRYDASHHIFTFPSGAKLAFGHMGRKGSLDTMQGAEFSFVGIDEATQHTETDAMYALSRLRRGAKDDIPLRARFSANPGGIGHQWVFNRFQMIKNKYFNPDDPHSPMYVGNHPKRLFIPSRLADNPYLDQESYVAQLKELDPITRSRLLEGDWSASPFGRFKPEWFRRYYYANGFILSDQGRLHPHQMAKFTTVDVAASFREGVGGVQFTTSSTSDDLLTQLSSADACWTVVAVWGVANNKLFLLDVFRKQTEIPEVFALLQAAEDKWGKMVHSVEKNGVGVGVSQGAKRLGYQVQEVWTTKDKIINSYDASNMAAQGSIYLPKKEGEDETAPDWASWLPKWEQEVFNWMGLRDETSDQVDTLSMAASKVAHMCLNKVGDRNSNCRMIPKVHGICKHGSHSWGSHLGGF